MISVENGDRCRSGIDGSGFLVGRGRRDDGSAGRPARNGRGEPVAGNGRDGFIGARPDHFVIVRAERVPFHNELRRLIEQQLRGGGSDRKALERNFADRYADVSEAR